jgi:hypothetical protein
MSTTPPATPIPKPVRGKFSGQTHDLESFIFAVRKEHPNLTRAQCLEMLDAEVSNGYCVEKPTGVFTWK